MSISVVIYRSTRINGPFCHDFYIMMIKSDSSFGQDSTNKQQSDDFTAMDKNFGTIVLISGAIQITLIFVVDEI